MDIVTISDVRKLVSIEDKRCVSIYMPTHPTGQEGQQDEVHLRRMIAGAEQQLTDLGMRGAATRDFLAPVSELPHLAEWPQRKQGLAILRAQNTFSHFWLATEVKEALVVGQRFYVRPLLPAIRANSDFYILAISRNHVRLLRATSIGCERLQPRGFPTDMEKGLNLQGADRGEQVHTGMRGDLGKEAGVFHGQGGHRDTMKVEVLEFAQLINESLDSLLHQSPLPLVLAGVDYEVAIFRKASDYAHIADESLDGNFDYVSDKVLYERALPIVRNPYDARRQQAISKCKSQLNRLLISGDLEEIITASHEGRIDTLFVDPQAEVFGSFDAKNNSVEIVDRTDPAIDLVELAIVQTVLHQGDVYAATSDELSSTVRMSAIFRY